MIIRKTIVSKLRGNDNMDKVLGFKGEDIFVFEKKKKKHILVERIGDETIQGNLAFELVPVVSLKALQKYCKKNHHNEIEELPSGGVDWEKVVNMDNLLAWAKKEARRMKIERR